MSALSKLLVVGGAVSAVALSVGYTLYLRYSR
jgi:hypothetical protein